MKERSTSKLSFYKKVIEALLFVSGRVLTLKELAKVCDGLSLDEVDTIIKELRKDYEGRGVIIREVAHGYRVETIPEVLEYIKRVVKPKNQRLTRSQLETLAIVAYFQPITRAEDSAKWGGVDSGPALKHVLERGLVKGVGRKQVPGRPPSLRHYPFFLEYFGVKSLDELPPLEELKKMAGIEDNP
jgi:segregation and condensation protein B